MLCYNIDAAEKMYRLLRLRLYKLSFRASERNIGTLPSMLP